MILPGVGSMMAGLSKSAPVQRGATQTAATSATSTLNWSPDIAAHEAGDVLVVIVANDKAAQISGSSGWDDPIGVTAGTTRIRVFTRTAVNNATTITLTASWTDSGKAIAHSYACQFADGDVATAGASATRDPASLTPAWGSETNLWIVAHAGASQPASGPDQFANGVQTSNDPLYLSTMDRSVDSPTLDPSAFSGGDDANDVVITLAVRPA